MNSIGERDRTQECFSEEECHSVYSIHVIHGREGERTIPGKGEDRKKGVGVEYILRLENTKYLKKKSEQ